MNENWTESANFLWCEYAYLFKIDQILLFLFFSYLCTRLVNKTTITQKRRITVREKKVYDTSHRCCKPRETPANCFETLLAKVNLHRFSSCKRFHSNSCFYLFIFAIFLLVLNMIDIIFFPCWTFCSNAQTMRKKYKRNANAIKMYIKNDSVSVVATTNWTSIKWSY